MPVEIIAHRGASADAPEHTIEAYDLALEQGADALEIDLRMTADHRLVAVHDPTLFRTHARPDAVAEMTLADVESVGLLRLGEIVRRYGRRTRLLLELKDPLPPMEKRLLRSLQGRRKRIAVQSFDARGLKRVRRLEPRLSVAPLYETAVRLDEAVALGATAISVYAPLVDAALVRAAHAFSVDVRAWTVNDPGEAVRLAAAGVDAIITDTPARIRAALAEAPALAA